MIFQEPMTSLNPCFTVGFQLTEGIAVHEGGTRAERRRRALELLDLVGIPAPEQRLRAFPHQLSGGMSQRVMIAMAIACNPRLLIADEPTTALDVTIQAQILDLLLALQRERGMALILITHDMAWSPRPRSGWSCSTPGSRPRRRTVAGLFADPAAPLYRGAAARAAGARRRRASCRPSPASCRAPATGRRAACSTRAARSRPSAASREEPPFAPGPRGQVRCHYPLTGGVPANHPGYAQCDARARSRRRPCTVTSRCTPSCASARSRWPMCVRRFRCRIDCTTFSRHAQPPRQLGLAHALLAHRGVQRELGGDQRRHRDHRPPPGRTGPRDRLAVPHAAVQRGHQAVLGKRQSLGFVVAPGQRPWHVGKGDVDRGAIWLGIQHGRIDVAHRRTSFTGPSDRCQGATASAQSSGRDLFVARRPKRRAAGAERDHAMAALAAGGIELEARHGVAPDGGACAAARCPSRTWIAVDAAGVKAGRASSRSAGDE